MKKRIIAVILSLAMSAACLTACSEEKNEEKNIADTTTVTSAATAASEETKEGETTTTQEKTTTAKQEKTTTVSKQTTTQSETSKTEPVVKKRRMLSKAEYYDDKNKVIERDEYNYTTDSKTGEIHCKRTDYGNCIPGDYESVKTKYHTIYVETYDKDFKILKTTSDIRQSLLLDQYEYDEKGRMKKYVEFFKSGKDKGKASYTTVYEYRSNDKLKRAVKRYNPENKVVTVYDYNEDGKLVKEDHGAGGYFEYKYNKKGQEISMEGRLKDGELVQKQNKKYDEHGNLCWYEVLVGDAEYEEYECINKYTDTGYSQTRYLIQDGKRQLIFKYTYKYDVDGTQYLVERKEYVKGKIGMTTKYTYVWL